VFVGAYRNHGVEAISSKQGIASGTPALAGGAREEQKRPRNDMGGNWSDYETMMQEKFGKDLTLHRVKYRTLKR